MKEFLSLPRMVFMTAMDYQTVITDDVCSRMMMPVCQPNRECNCQFMTSETSKTNQQKATANVMSIKEDIIVLNQINKQDTVFT